MPPGKPMEPFSERELKMIESMGALGMTQANIALVLGISRETLRRRLILTCGEKGRGFIKKAKLSAVNNVAKTAYDLAVSGKHPVMTMFYLKTQGRWRETHRVEHTGKGGKPLSFAALAVQVTREIEGVAKDVTPEGDNGEPLGIGPGDPSVEG